MPAPQRQPQQPPLMMPLETVRESHPKEAAAVDGFAAAAVAIQAMAETPSPMTAVLLRQLAALAYGQARSIERGEPFRG